MFSKFTLPRSFLSNAIVQSELNYLHQVTKSQQSWLQRLNRTLSVTACCAAMLPLWLYMDDQIRTYVLIFFMGLIIYFVHLLAATRTLTLASQSIARETESGNWDNLVMTGLNARQIILSKWWAVMRCVWKDRLFAASLKIGLVIALGQYFNVVGVTSCYRHLGGGLCYFSDVYYYPTYGFSNFAIAMILSLLFLIAFGIIECGLLTAVGLYTAIFSKYRIVGMAWAIAIRGLMVVLAVLAFFLIASRSRKIFEQGGTCTTRWFMNCQERLNTLGNVQLSLSTIADSGTIITTDLIRHTSNYDYLLGRLGSIVIMLAVFAWLTHFTLKLAQHAAVKNHALKPPA